MTTAQLVLEAGSATKFAKRRTHNEEALLATRARGVGELLGPEIR
jgi:hypothetical protein